MFFVISGFVIARLLLDEIETTGHLNFGTFYTRRLRRLLPALAVMVSTVAVASIWLLGPAVTQPASARTGTAASLWVANFQLLRLPDSYFGFESQVNAFLHTWSLSVEEQFYLLFPGLLWIVWRICARGKTRVVRSHVFIVFTLLLAGSFLLSVLTCRGHGQFIAHLTGGMLKRVAFYLPLARIWEFCAGILVALLADRLAAISRSLAELAGLAGVALLCFAAITINESDAFPGSIAAWPVLGTALIILSGFHERSSVRRVLALTPLVWIGDISYGWYLWHWPLIVFVKSSYWGNSILPGVAAIAALIPTLLSYHFVENPIRHNSAITGRRIVALVVICVTTSLTACFSLRYASRHLLHRGAGQSVVTSQVEHADNVNTCRDGQRLNTLLRPCLWRAKGERRGTIYLVGDSNAGQFTEVVAAAGTTAGYDVMVQTRYGCPFVDIDAEVADHDAKACRAYVESSVRSLLQARPALVIVASASSTWIEEPGRGVRAPSTGEVSNDRDVKSALWESGLRAAIAPLSAAHIPVTVVTAIPHPQEVVLSVCPEYRIATDIEACSPSVSRAEIEEGQHRARDAERKAVANLPDVSALDVTDVLCDASVCPTRVGGAWLYRNSAHLTIAGAMLLRGTFDKLIAERAR